MRVKFLILSLVFGVCFSSQAQRQTIQRSGGSGSSGSVTNGSVNITTNLTVGSQSGFTGIATASLPTGVAAGYQTYATDALTPFATGSRVEWDGSVWRTIPWRVTATTDVPTFILGSASVGLNISTPLSDIALCSMINAATWTFPRSAASSGTASAANMNNATGVGTWVVYDTGTTSTGSGRSYGPYSTTLTSGDSYASGGTYSVNVVPDGTDNYWCMVGFDSSASAVAVTTGAYFLYDKYNATSHGQNYTNNWICVTARSSSYSYADSGLSVSTSQASADRLAVICTTTSCKFYTNGVLAATLSTAGTIPNTGIYATKVVMLKTLGSTSRKLYETNPWLHFRRNSARTY